MLAKKILGGGILKANEIMGLNPKGVIFMKKTLSIVLLVLLVFLAVACSPEHKHDYQLVESKSIKATCTSNGYDYYECSCGAITSVPTQALGHDNVLVKEVAATCVDVGKRYYVCQRCEEPSNKDTAIDPDNHVYSKMQNIKKTITPETCGTDGLAIYGKCSACGATGELEVVIPAGSNKSAFGTTDGHYKLNDEGTERIAVTVDDIEYWETTSEPTIFAAGKETAYCPLCNGEFDDATGFVDRTVNPKSDDIVGNWLFSDVDSDDSTTFANGYLTVTKDNGLYNVEAYMLKSEAGVYTGTPGSLNSQITNVEVVGFAKLTDGTLTSTYDYLNLENVLLFNAGTSYYFVTSVKTETEDVSLDSGREVDLKADDIIIGTTTTKANVADGESSTAVGTLTYLAVGKKVEHEHAFKLMSGNGAVLSNCHYVECECGLKFVQVAHGSGCDKCGYENSWKNIVIYKNGNKDSFWAPVKKGISLGTTGTKTYVTFFGEKVAYDASKTNATNSDTTKSKNGVYYCAADQSTMTITLSE